jgi:ABC-type transport system involved in multi-copper enzyme maturation permease subunit
MIWLTWRQFRPQALIALGILVAAVIYFLITGLSMHHDYAINLTSCVRLNNCGSVLQQFQHGYDGSFHFIQVLVIAAPGLIGIFWGAPLIGHELETGTDQLAWNQSVTRTRWLAVKLTVVGVAAMASAAALSYLATWWAGPLDHVIGNRFASLTFASRDIVPLAYAIFAFALGTTAGLILRRTVPAMAVTLAVFAGIQILVPAAVRPNLLPSTTVTFPVNETTASQATGIYTQGGGAQVYLSGLPVPRGAWVISAPPVEEPSGQVVPAYKYSDCFGLASTPGPAKGGGPGADKIAACLARYNLHESITYQPARYYWPLQWCETGIFLLLTAVLSLISFWWIRRRRS